MASLLPKLAFLIFILSTLLFPITNSFKSIFSFGDSLADTGNILHSASIATYLYARPPYGETHFGRPTGRCSNGRLIVDFFAEAYGLPLLPPFLSGSPGKDFRQGVNFAVVGATALDNSFFEERGIINPLTTNSLSDQISWFKELLPSLCATPKDCIDYLGNSLFLVGEIGGNDVNYGFLQGRSMQEVRGFVPNIIDAITSAIRSLIKEGAMELVVPGNLPFGCSPIYLTMFQSSSKSEYDSLGCLSSFNDFSIYFNTQLQEALQKLRLENPHVKIIYADYYNASLRFYKSPLQFGGKDLGQANSELFQLRLDFTARYWPPPGSSLDILLVYCTCDAWGCISNEESTPVSELYSEEKPQKNLQRSGGVPSLGAAHAKKQWHGFSSVSMGVWFGPMCII